MRDTQVTLRILEELGGLQAKLSQCQHELLDAIGKRDPRADQMREECASLARCVNAKLVELRDAVRGQH